MTKIYYCKNEDDMKRVAIHIFEKEINNSSFEDGIDNSGIYCCDYKSEEIECCQDCNLEECLLCKHLEDKNVHKHIELMDKYLNYPYVVCVADTYHKKDSITVCSIADAKDNTKYGF